MTSRKAVSVLLAVLVATALAIALTGCTGPGTPGTGGGTGSTTTIVEKDFRFSPSSVSVQIGDTVVFDNQDTVPHHVVVGTADLGEQQPGKSVSWTADANGTFPLKCLIHASMMGQVTVGSSGSAPSAPVATSTPPSTGGY